MGAAPGMNVRAGLGPVLQEGSQQREGGWCVHVVLGVQAGF